ncbi:hypothetical protein GM415_15280 [Pseudodesulfovibrio cashew]|uniref:Uncharacterized protein n=1 Tax=Pseudodesulfovibrio cashew TaxID=2678688 RepID=A0A6I6JGW9_9BACT|nr:hypothetical protein [Pseudodesulfovibrio cashew]QGY41421.1 hypothetical protein GM415_15280 [Pseudodesulfovibrio cashew]
MEISRKDVVLDDAIFSELVRVGSIAQCSMFDIFAGIRIYLEENGEVVAEFLPDDGTLHYVTFRLCEWSPAEEAPAKIVRAYEAALRKADCGGGVYDIFTGQKINTPKRKGELGEKLRRRIEAQ